MLFSIAVLVVILQRLCFISEKTTRAILFDYSSVNLADCAGNQEKLVWVIKKARYKGKPLASLENTVRYSPTCIRISALYFPGTNYGLKQQSLA